jgi:hypothetical protein
MGSYVVSVYVVGAALDYCLKDWELVMHLSFTSLPCAQDTGGESPCIDTQDGLKLLIVGDSAVRLLVTLGARSAW